MGVHQTFLDFLPLAKSMSAEGFCARFASPFLVGVEVVEDEFRFTTAVTDRASLFASSVSTAPLEGNPARTWIIPVKKTDGAAGEGRVFFGRSSSNDVCVPHRTVSKLHG